MEGLLRASVHVYAVMRTGVYVCCGCEERIRYGCESGGGTEVAGCVWRESDAVSAEWEGGGKCGVALGGDGVYVLEVSLLHFR